MIVSASRRTDIPAFYAEWFINRIRAGLCAVPNPFSPGQVLSVSLRPEDVDVIVFWTRNPRPLMPHLAALDERGYRYYFQYTLLNNPRLIDPHALPLEASLRTFRELADHVGAERVVWRYDPIVFSNVTGAELHRRTFERIAQALRGSTRRCVVSILDVYPKTRKRWKALAQQGIKLTDCDGQELGSLMRHLVEIAATNGMEITSCAELLDLRPYGIQPGKCVDDEYIARVLGLDVTHRKDPSQRAACGCVVSRDIGMYDSCLCGCVYCYATSSFEQSRKRHQEHDPDSPMLIGQYVPQHTASGERSKL